MTGRPLETRDHADAAHALAGLAMAAPDSRVQPRTRAAPPTAARARAARMRRLGSLGSPVRLNLTPMIDVVFQLLVFFIATTRFVSNEHVLRMDVPQRTAALEASDATADPFAYVEDALRIEVKPGGTLSARAPVASATTAPQLRRALEAARRDAANPAGALPMDFPIVIAPVNGATWQDAIDALNAAVGAGYRNVTFDQPPGAPGS